MKSIIESIVNSFLMEHKTYDKLTALKQQYRSEQEKNFEQYPYKKALLKNKMLFKQYLEKHDELSKEKNAYGLKGDMNAKYIYHYTDGDSLLRIIEDGYMIGGDDDYGGVSFTSHPNLYKRGFVFWHPSKYSKGRHHGNIGVKMKFDFKKMKSDGMKFKGGSEDMNTHAGEDEIRLMVDDFHNPLNYIVEIIVFKNKESNYTELSNVLKSLNIKHKIV